MTNKFIEELRKKAEQNSTVQPVSKRKYPWIPATVEEQIEFEKNLGKMFNPKGGEDR